MNLKSFQYIDIHTHVNFAAFDADREAVISRALDCGVALINVGTQKDTSLKAVEIAEKYESGVYAIVGVHPIHTSKSFHDTKELGEGNRGFTSRGEIFDYEYYKKLASHPKVVAIGECGLDYYRNMEHGTWSMEQKKQKEVFRKQIELAVEIGKPLMLHLRNGIERSAYNDAFSILKSYNLNLKSNPGNLHFFAGSIDEAKQFLDIGFSFSFTGVITFAKEYAEIIKYLPLNRIMSETDAPYAAPAPYRGKRNEPFYVKEVVSAIAEIRGESLEIVKNVLVSNARKFFGLV